MATLPEQSEQPDTEQPEHERDRARAEREDARRELSRKGVVFGTLIAVLAVVGGAAVGFVVTLAIVVARARYGSYIFGMEELAAFRWETAPILLGMAGGVTLAILHPRALDRATVRGFVGLLVGSVAGIFLGRQLWGPAEGAWAGGIVFGAAGLVVGAIFAVAGHEPHPERRPLLAGGLGSSLLLAGAVFLVVGFTRLVTNQPLDLPSFEAIPVPDPADVDAVVFLVGDAGATERGRAPLLRALGDDVERWSAALGRDSAVSVVYLGDLVYPVGVRDRDHPAFETDSTRLWNQIDIVAGEHALEHKSLGLFLPGNHDWGSTSGLEGIDRILNLDDQLELARRDGLHVSLTPPGGRPGPAVRDLRRNVRLVFLDTHWFLQTPAAADREGFFDRLEETFETAGDRELILAAHHPFHSAGPHGALLPGYHAGGVAYLLKKSGTLVQDLNSPVYGEFLAGLRAMFERQAKPPLIFAGGHDHSLQVLQENRDFDPSFSLVSGAGSKLSGLRGTPGLAWGADRPGYMMLVFRADDAVDLFVIAGDQGYLKCAVPDEELESCMTEGVRSFEIAYSATLLGPSKNPVDIPAVDGDTVFETPWRPVGEGPVDVPSAETEDPVMPAPLAVPGRVLATATESVTTTPGRSYPAGPIHRFFFGELNRHLWAIPLQLPVLDLEAVGGGLEPVELTGGEQTIGLRLRGNDGLEYGFRALVKDPSRALPSLLRRGVVDEVLDDQMAAQFPLAALVVAELQEAAGILAPKPIPVVMPNDSRLGDYRRLFAGRVGLFALEADEGRDGAPGFAGYSRIVGTDKLYDVLRWEPDNHVDASYYLRIRMLDALVGDWDRHSGQWRWAARKGPDGVTWRPIPADRDWAFVKIDGLLNRIGSVLLPRYVSFEEGFPPARRLVSAGYRIDHRVLNGLDRDDFVAAARDVRAAITDSVLERAIGQLPAAYLEHVREPLTAALKLRRAELTDFASEYYDAFSQTVHAYGYAGSPDVIAFEAVSDESAILRLHSGGEGGPVRFERVISSRDTRKVRLFIDENEDRVVGGDDLPFDLEIEDEDEDEDGEDRDY